MYFFTLLDQVTYFRYIVGKSTPFSIILESLVSYFFSIFRGCAFFSCCYHSLYSSSKYIERYRAIQIIISLFLCRMSSFVCVFICFISSCSLSPFLLVVDTSPIPMISLTSLLLSYIDTEEKQNLSVLSFSFSLFRCT